MKASTVKKRIFLENTAMVFVILLLFFVINFAAVKIYSEMVETEVKASFEQMAQEGNFHQFAEQWTIRQDQFFLIFGVDGIICILIVVLVSQLFTRRLTGHIMEPLDALTQGAKRIKKNDLTEEILYKGETEFEQVCIAFNEMQKHLLEEQQKNQKYEQARTKMIAGISHDLRTPLTAIKGTIKGLLDGVAKTEQQRERFLQTAYRRTGDVDALLEQLFYFSKMETGNMPFYCQKINLIEFLNHYAEEKRNMLDLQKESLEIKADLPEESEKKEIEVFADAGQLQRVFDNLLENSRKYAEKLPLQMQIHVKTQENTAVICFRDNGVGVEKEKLPYIFEEFYRADESRNQKKGNGLGLYIVKYLMKEMNGTVRAENDGGLAVYLELPLEEGGEHEQKNSDCGR